MIEILLILLALITSLSINGFLTVKKIRQEFDRIQLPKYKPTIATIIFQIFTSPFVGFIMLFPLGRYGFVISIMEELKSNKQITKEQAAELLLLAIKSEKW